MAARRDFVAWPRASYAYVRGRVEPRARWTLFELVGQADFKTGAVNGSIHRLATELGISRNTLKAHLGVLVEAGEVVVVSGSTGTEIIICHYDLLIGGSKTDPGKGGSTGGSIGGSTGGSIDGSNVAPVGPQRVSTAARLGPEELQDYQDLQDHQDRFKNRRAKNRASGLGKRPIPSSSSSPADDPEMIFDA